MNFYVCILCYCFNFLQVYTGVSVWTGIENTDWYNENNWNTKAIPTATDKVIIPCVDEGRFFPIFQGITQINSLNIEANAKLKVDLAGLLEAKHMCNQGIILGAGTLRAKTIENTGFINQNTLQIPTH